MSIAAVPEYLQKDDPQFYLAAPPGHRFLLYFAAWGDNRELDQIDWRMKDRVPKIDKKTGNQKVGKSGPEWDDLPNGQHACTIAACKTPSFDDERPRSAKPKADPGLKPWRPMMAGLHNRQTAIADVLPTEALLRFDAKATAPFTTGLGNEHPLENGFAFLNPYGLPYLPGSGVKGVLRQAARELAGGDWGDARGWLRGEDGEEKPFSVVIQNKTVALSLCDVLFGRESRDGDSEHVRGALSFWDVIPQIAPEDPKQPEQISLAVDIMTPHQGHYYQWKKDRNGNPIEVSPHESGQPNPISFLTVPPGSDFTFHLVCDLPRLRRLAPELARDDQWKNLITAAFEHAFAWLGFGAKTAVGYGAMMRDQKKEDERRRAADAEAERRRQDIESAANEAARQEALDRLDPVERSIQEFLAQRRDKNQSELSAVIGAVKQNRWSGDEKIAVARWLKNLMQATKGQWKESSQAKKPAKDREFQNTLQVKSWLEGK